MNGDGLKKNYLKNRINAGKNHYFSMDNYAKSFFVQRWIVHKRTEVPFISTSTVFIFKSLITLFSITIIKTSALHCWCLLPEPPLLGLPQFPLDATARLREWRPWVAVSEPWRSGKNDRHSGERSMTEQSARPLHLTASPTGILFINTHEGTIM